MSRETAAQRRMRIAQEEREAELKWDAEKPMRLLNALAAAKALNISAYVFYRRDDILYYCFSFTNEHDECDEFCDTVVELTESTMRTIEAYIDSAKAKKVRGTYLERVRNDLLKKLTDDEKEALGL